MKQVKQLTTMALILLVIVGMATIFPTRLKAADNTDVKAQGTIIVDFTGVNTSSGTLVYRLFGLDIADIVNQLNTKLPPDKQIDLCLVLGARAIVKTGACGDQVPEESDINTARLTFLKELKKKYTHATEHRWLSKKNQVLEVYVFHNGKSATIKIEEKNRSSKLAQDITTLAKLVAPLLTKDGGAISMVDEQYRLEKHRGKLQVTVNLDTGEKKEEKMEIITGPVEHWFLSADLPSLKLSKVKFTGDQGSIEPKETPKVFYLGVNWMIGDVLKERQHILKNFFIKGMVKFSKKPLDSYGFGIGYRFPEVRILGLDMSAFSVFAAWLWTKEELEDKTTELTKRQVQLGFGFNLDKALSWNK